MSSSEFFIAGGTLGPTSASYVERQADHDLVSALLAGEYCYVLDTRQMGKSSLMVRTAARLREQGVAVAVLDLTSIGQNLTVERWYAGLLARLDEQLDLKGVLLDGWREQKELGGLQRFLDGIRMALRSIDGPLTIFVDEVDAVRSLPFPVDEFFIGIRECYNRRTLDPIFNHLVFCLIGVASPPDLIQDTRLSPFNIGRRITLSDFTSEEGDKLIRVISGGENAQQRVLYWTGGHPYLTQRLCREIAESGGGITSADVDRLCHRLFLTHQARENDDNLAFVRNRLLQSETDRSALLDLYRAIVKGASVRDDETNPLCSILRLSGVVRADATGTFSVRNRIYQRVFDAAWIRDNMPDAELRRQRVAFWRGVWQTALIGGSFTVLLAGMGVFAFVKARQAQEYERQAATRLSRLAVQEGIRNLQEGNPEAARSSLQNALQVDRRSFPDRLWADERRLAFAVRQLPKQIATLECAGPITWAAFSPDGKRIAAVTAKGNIRLWDAQTGAALATEQTFPVTFSHVAFSPDGKFFAAFGRSGKAYLCDATTGKTIHVLTHFDQRGLEQWITWKDTIVFSRDGKRMATIGRPGIAIWETQAGKEISRVWDNDTKPWTAQQCDIPLLARTADFSPDGKTIAFGNYGYLANRASVATGKMSGYFQECWTAESLCYSPDGKTVLITGVFAFGNNPLAFGACLFHSLTGERQGRFLGHNDRGVDGVFSPDGKLVATASRDGGARVWDAVTGEPVTPELRHRAAIHTVRFSPSGRHMATASQDGLCRIWDTRSGAPAGSALSHPAGVLSAEFSPDGKTILTVCSDGKARLWEWKSNGIGEERTILPVRRNVNVMLEPIDLNSPSGLTQILVRENPIKPPPDETEPYLWVYDLAQRGPDPNLARLQGKYMEESPDRKQVLMQVGKQTRVYERETGRLIRRLPSMGDASVLFTEGDDRHRYFRYHKLNGRWWIFDTETNRFFEITGRQFFPKLGKAMVLPVPPGRQLKYFDFGPRHNIVLDLTAEETADGEEGETLSYLVDLRQGTTVPVRLRNLRFYELGPDAVNFSYNERYLAIAGYEGRIYDTRTGKALTPSLSAGRKFTVTSFSPDEAHVAFAADDSTIHLFESTTGKESAPAISLPSPISKMAFSPDGKFLIVACQNNTVSVWECATGEPMTPFLAQDAVVQQVAFTQDSQQLVVILRHGNRDDLVVIPFF